MPGGVGGTVPGRRNAGVEALVASRWWPRVAVLVAGALPALAFPEPSLDLLAWVALVPVLLLVHAARSASEAALRGWLAGVGFLAATQNWVAPNLVFFFPLAVGVLALLWAAWAVLAHELLRAPISAPRAAGAVVVLPAGWVLVEVARSWQWLGGPWSLLGATQWQHPRVLALASIGGVWLVGFAVVAANVGLTLLLVGGAGARWCGGVAVLVAVGAGPVAFATLPGPSAGPTVAVALVQPGLPTGDLLTEEERLTRAIGRPVDLVVWGESSVDADLDARPDVLGRLTALSREVGAPLLVNVDALDATGAVAKTAVLLDGDGVRATYRKNRLVPFGEYIPFRDQLGWLSRITAAAGQNRRPGHELTTMDAAGLTLGPLISFEETFPDLARSQARGGADLLVYQSSTATFQGSWAPAQLASVGAVRAAETGRPVVAAALTGESAGFDASGNRLGSMPADERGVLVLEVPTGAWDTPFDGFGNHLPVVATVVVLLGVGGAGMRRIRAFPDRCGPGQRSSS
ncbi:apolipoprotein N-acyltransferase [Rhodococcus kronopolitis]|uniref:Apolipoprotein N-acyltransferase n=1 Tax=Rhodococcus kronopolitis TaxID=1460226 RepID=A0ABV9FXR4_9NOCA